jgi:hypothetical protein
MGQAAKKAEKRVNKISGVHMEHADRGVMEAAIDKLGLDKDYDADMTDEQVTVVLHTHFAKSPKDDLVECDVCKGVSSLEVDACPYCGHEDAGDGGETAKKDEGKMTTTQTVETESKKTDKQAQLAMVPAPSKKPAPLAVVKDDTRPSSEIKGVRELDAAVREVEQAKAMTVAGMWVLGEKIAVIYDGQLYKHRLGEDGKTPRYKSFEAFCSAELKMTHTNAFKAIDLRKAFSHEQVKTFGTKKLGLLLELPKEDQEQVLKAHVEKGATSREVEKVVRKLKKEKGHVRARRDTGTVPKPAKPRAQKVTTVTVANIVGRETVKLYQKPTTRNFELKDLKRANKISHQPYGRLELTNGVVQEFFIRQSAAGDWELIVGTRRNDEE